MKLRRSLALTTAILSTSLPGIAEAGLFSLSKKGEMPKELKVRTTAYTHTESDHIKYGKKTAAGGTLKYTKKYTSAAADWSKFPLGTKFKIDGINTTFVVDDYGRALVGSETIDIYHPSKSAMNNWGVKHVDIEVLEYGDFEASREILSQRTKYAHVRKMLAGIKKDPGPERQKGPLIPSPKPASPKQPDVSIPEPPKALPEPAVLVASTPKSIPPPSPTPEPAPAPAPKPDPIPQTAPEPPKAPTEDIPETPRVAQVTPPPAAPAPTPSSTAPPGIVAPNPTPTPAVRKFQPLSVKLVSASSADKKAPSINEDANNEAPEQPSMQPSTPSAPKFRKRAFKPMLASANG